MTERVVRVVREDLRRQVLGAVEVVVEEGRVRLQPANSTMQPIYTEPDNVEIKGRVIGVIRRMD